MSEPEVERRLAAGEDAELQRGDRIRLEATDDEFTHLAAGDEGTVTRTSWQPDIRRPGVSIYVVDVRWDSGSVLSMIPHYGDRYSKL